MPPCPPYFTGHTGQYWTNVDGGEASDEGIPGSSLGGWKETASGMNIQGTSGMNLLLDLVTTWLLISLILYFPRIF